MDIHTELRGISLFSGICGIELGLKAAMPGYRTICYCENDPYCQKVIQSRIRSQELDDAPIWDDVTTFDGKQWRGVCDIITGGFPCQDISVAGKRAGIKRGTRSGLWFEFARIIEEVEPRFVFIENVRQLAKSGIDIVKKSLNEIGYHMEDPIIVSAADVGAPHRRARLFILAYPNRESDIGRPKPQLSVCDAARSRDEFAGSGDESPIRNPPQFAAAIFQKFAHSGITRERRSESPNSHWWSIEPDVGRVAYGVPQRVDKLRCLGNAVVHQQAEAAWKILTHTL
jgi:DNA (cytosine-5)-methyltransferase 1